MTHMFIIALIANIRPFLGPSGCCRYVLTCSRFARLVIKHYPLYRAVPIIFRRILSCSPLTGFLRKMARKRLLKDRLR